MMDFSTGLKLSHAYFLFAKALPTDSNFCSESACVGAYLSIEVV